MSKELSIYLDLMRFLAAILVFFSHYSFFIFTGDRFNYLHGFGQTAVIIFFVLSGYVIAFVVDKKEHTLKAYFISRFSRLYSVVLAVLLFVFILDKIGQSINPLIYEGYFRDSNLALRAIFNVFFLQQIWFYGIGYLSNGPLWSLGYEFWYYVLFGVTVFIKDKKKYVYLLLIALLIGPKILLLLPVWLLGTYTYTFHKKHHLNQFLARVLFFSTPFVFLFIFTLYDEINQFIYSVLGESIKAKLGYSYGFITDYITGIFVGVHILSMKDVNLTYLNRMLKKGEKVIRFFANSSFSIYLFHFPLLLFYGALFNHNPNSVVDMFILLSITFLSCLALAQVTEKKKHFYKKQITSIWNTVENRITK